MKFTCLLLSWALSWNVLAACAWGQAAAPADSPDEAQQRELSMAMQEAGNSAVDYVRVLEEHLKKYPNGKGHDTIERALVTAAIEAKDNRRVVLYGQHVLESNPKDVQILQKVAAALLTHDDRESAEKACGYAHRLELELTERRSQPPPEGYSVARWQNVTDHHLADALRLEAEAQGKSGNTVEAEALARRSWQTNPT